MTWEDFTTPTGQLALLVALTGLVYRLLRLWWPDTPEPVVQFIAAIFATASNLMASYVPEANTGRWIVLGIASGVFLSQNVVKSIDWITAAATKTGAPQLGQPEQPPAWFVAALAKGATVETTAPVTPKSPTTLAKQAEVNAAAVEKAKRHAGPGKPEGWE